MQGWYNLTSRAMLPPCARKGVVAWQESPTPVMQPSNQDCPGFTCLSACTGHLAGKLALCVPEQRHAKYSGVGHSMSRK